MKIRDLLIVSTLVLLGFVIGLNFKDFASITKMYYASKTGQSQVQSSPISSSINTSQYDKLQSQVVPKEGFTLPISWGDLGPRLVSLGVIDLGKFKSGIPLSPEQEEIFTKGVEVPIKIDSTNSQFVVDLLWAVGLAQKSLAYTEGPIGTQYKTQQGDFASTGGWTLAKGDAVNYLGKYDLMGLSSQQQEKVKEIAQNIYRPCCGNSTWFPDCNHGMAALGAIELMVAKNLPDEEIYKNILKLNSFWFPSTYITTAVYFDNQGTSWDKVDAKTVLGEKFSSASGANNIAQEVGPLPGQESGGSCGA